MRTFRDWLQVHAQHFPDVHSFDQQRQKQWWSLLRSVALEDLARYSAELGRRQADGFEIPPLLKHPGWMLHEEMLSRGRLIENCEDCGNSGYLRVQHPENIHGRLNVACWCANGRKHRMHTPTYKSWMKRA